MALAALHTQLWDTTTNVIETLKSAIPKLEQLSTRTENARYQESLQRFAQRQSDFILAIEELRHAQAMSLDEHNINIELPRLQELVLFSFHYVRVLAFAMQCLENIPPDLTELQDIQSSVMHFIEAGHLA